jgi:Dual specificity phosphatase, catalytic domain
VDWINDQVAIGDHAEARDAGLLRQQGVRSVLSLDGSLAPADAEGLRVAAVVAFDLIDGAGNEPGALGRAVAALEGLLRDHPPVLVHCHAGRSRSVVVVAALLARTLRLGPAEAVARVAARRVVCITPEFEELLYERDWFD